MGNAVNTHKTNNDLVSTKNVPCWGCRHDSGNNNRIPIFFPLFAVIHGRLRAIMKMMSFVVQFIAAQVY